MADVTLDTEILANSVTRDEVTKVRNGAVMFFVGPSLMRFTPAGGLPVDPPPYWSFQRDHVLAITTHREGTWAGAVGIGVTKMASQSWEVKGEKPRLRERAHEIMRKANMGLGWVHFCGQHIPDFLLCDNGAHLEVVRASSSRSARVLGFVHLDSHRCIRTGDPTIPILYRDLLGRLHELKYYQVLSLSDMPTSRASYYGVGLCAASRAYSHIYRLAAIERYISEKVSGGRVLEVHLVSGIQDKQLKSGIETAKDEAVRAGAVSYMGAALIATGGEEEPGSVSIPLASVPDGFDRKEEFDIAVLNYANAIGLDPQDLQPLGGQALGTGAQSAILDDKARGKGLAAWRQQFTHLVNEFVLPETVTHVFIEKDYRDMKLAADVTSIRGAFVAEQITAGVISPQQALQYLVDKDELPKEYLPGGDTTPAGSLSDADKPDAIPEGATPAQLPGPAPAVPAAPGAPALPARPAGPPVGFAIRHKREEEDTVDPIGAALETMRAATKHLLDQQAALKQAEPPEIVVHVAAPVVHVQAPPPSPAPVVNVQPPTVNVTAEVQMPETEEALEVERDAEGLIRRIHRARRVVRKGGG